MKTIKDILNTNSIEQRRRIAKNLVINKEDKDALITHKSDGGGEIKYEYYTLDSNLSFTDKRKYCQGFLYFQDSAYVLYEDKDSGLIFETNMNQIIQQCIAGFPGTGVFDYVVAIKCTVHDKSMFTNGISCKLPNGSLIDKINYLNIDLGETFLATENIIPITKDEYESMITATIEDVYKPIN